MIDIVIPTIDGREADLQRCVDSYMAHAGPPAINIIIIRDQPTAGAGWKAGLAKSRAPYVHLSADDLELIDSRWAVKAMTMTDLGFLPCPTIRRPDGSLESCGGDMGAPECLIRHLNPHGTEVDFTVLPFMSREQADRIGMIESHYLCDTFVSYRGRQLGYATRITEGYELVHHHSNVGRFNPWEADRAKFEAAMAAPANGNP